MEVFKDFEEWFVLLNKQKVDYLVVGGYAVGHHGHPRYTGDLDIFYRLDQDNVQAILKALDEFGFGELGLTQDDLLKPGVVIQLGYPPEQIDLINRISGVAWQQAKEDRALGHYGDVEVYFLGLKSLLINKRSTGRAKDLGDVEELDL